jgi:hypothetical protein
VGRPIATAKSVTAKIAIAGAMDTEADGILRVCDSAGFIAVSSARFCPVSGTANDQSIRRTTFPKADYVKLRAR